MTGRRHVRWPLDPVVRLVRPASDADLAEAVDVHPRTVQRWRESGLTDHQADRVAVRLGLVPELLWDQADQLIRTERLQPSAG